MPHIQFEKLPKRDLVTRLRPYHTAITKSASEGNMRAKEVVTLYRMHVSCPEDPGAKSLCEAAFDAWLQQRKVA